MTPLAPSSRTAVRSAPTPLDDHTVRLIRHLRAQRRRRLAQRVLTRA